MTYVASRFPTGKNDAVKYASVPDIKLQKNQTAKYGRYFVSMASDVSVTIARIRLMIACNAYRIAFMMKMLVDAVLI